MKSTALPRPGLKISYITIEFPSPSETFAANDVTTLLRHGHAISVHTLRPPHSLHQKMIRERQLESVPIFHNDFKSSCLGLILAVWRPRLTANCIRFLFRHKARAGTSLLKLLLLVPQTIRIVCTIKRQRPDVVHLFWGHYTSLAGYLIKCFAHPNGQVTMFLGAYDLAKQWSGSLAMAQLADAVFTHANINRIKLEEAGVEPKKICVVHRGLHLDQVKQHYHHQKTPFQIMTACRLIRQKGTHLVLEAFSKLQIAFPQAKLVILGDGPDRPYLDQQLQALNIHNVFLAGHQSYRETLRYMARSEVFLYLSYDPTDRLPNVVKEAMALKCLCIVSTTTGIDELIVPNQTGYIITNDLPQKASDIMTHFFSNREKYQPLFEQARHRIETTFNVDQTMRQYEEVWQKGAIDTAASPLPR